MALAEKFVLAADEMSMLEGGSEEESSFFQRLADRGALQGRGNFKGTRQGIYTATPSGRFLGVTNSNQPEDVSAMLREALREWDLLSRKDRLLDRSLSDRAEPRWPSSRQFPRESIPRDGIVLRSYSKDLPREHDTRPDEPLRDDWNTDFVWIRAEEILAMIPSERSLGTSNAVPAGLLDRLVRFHLVDNVHGIPEPYEREDVEEAELIAEVQETEGDTLRLSLRGKSRAATRGWWPVTSKGEPGEAVEANRGYDAVLVGRVEYDLTSARVLRFDLVAVGTRWGATNFNWRANDPGPAGMGIAFQLYHQSPDVSNAPHFLSTEYLSNE